MPLQHTAAHTIFAQGNEKLTALCAAIGATRALEEEARAAFRVLTHPWGDAPIGDPPYWRSDITDDYSPYEFSLATERHQPELRILVEAKPRLLSVASQWEAGRELCDTIARDYGASFDRLRTIEDLFAVDDPAARFGMWHAVNLREGAPPAFKVYLNPQGRTDASARAVVGAALSRLGLAGALEALPAAAGGPEEVKYFALDLDAGADARVKVYFAPRCATVGDIESALSAAANYVPGEATAFCRAMAGEDGPYSAMPVQICFAFTSGGGPRPAAATIYFPIRAYVPSDAAARTRILNYMVPEDRPLYARVIDTFAGRSLEVGTGMQTYVSYRRQRGANRVTVYLSPEVYSAEPQRSERFVPPVSGVMLSHAAVDEAREGRAGGSR